MPILDKYSGVMVVLLCQLSLKKLSRGLVLVHGTGPDPVLLLSFLVVDRDPRQQIFASVAGTQLGFDTHFVLNQLVYSNRPSQIPVSVRCAN